MSIEDKFQQLETLLHARNLRAAIHDIGRSHPELAHSIIDAVNSGDSDKYDAALKALEAHNEDLVSSFESNDSNLDAMRSREPARSEKKPSSRRSSRWDDSNERVRDIWKGR